MSSNCSKRMGSAAVVLALVTLGAGPVWAQATGTVTGTVEDGRTGLPVAAVQVFISDLDIGALTQPNGRYVLSNIPAGPHTVSATRIGYRQSSVTVTVPSGGTAVANFRVTEEALQLDEVVVTGTAGGSQRRAVGNVVSRVDAAAVREVAPSVNLEQVLGTRVPGLATMASGGMVGSGAADIRIRGASSVGLPNDPLIYIDGVRVNAERTEGRRQTTSRLNDINPEDIASIEVIKGPAASTLYGTEASNGVIQIITKRGQEGAVRFDASVELGVNYMANPREKVWTNYGTCSTAQPCAGLPTGEIVGINMMDAWEQRNGSPLMTNGPIRNVSLSAQGGTAAIRYFASFTRNDQQGPLDWNWEVNNTGRLNLDLTVNDQISLGVSGSFMSGQTRVEGDFWVQTMRGTPLSAEEFGFSTPLNGWGTLTPEALRDGSEWMFDTERKNASVTVQWAPWPWFQHRATGGVDLTDQIEHYIVFRESNAPNGIWQTAGLGQRDVNDRETQLSTLDYSATASLDLTPQLGSATSAGFQYYEKKLWSTDINADEFATELLTTAGAAARTTASESQLANVTAGFYVQQQLDWADRIFLQGAVRFDENSAFGSDYGTQIYPKASATWVLSEESFWPLEFVNPLRLRAAWGAAGRQPDVFAAQRLYDPDTGPNNLPILTPNSYGNASLGPEKAQELEVGFDASFLERFTLEFTAYWKTTKDGIVNQLMIPSLGFPGSQFLNAGEIKNWGTEWSLGVEILRNDPVRWDVQIAAATMDNEIRSLGDVDRLFLQRSREHVVGFPLAGLHDFKVLSADLVPGGNGAVTNAMCDSGIPSGVGYLPGGAPVPCSSPDAHRVYWGPSHNTWTLNATSTWVLYQDWRLFGSLEGRGGGILHADQVGARHSSWANSYAYQLKDVNPVFWGQMAVSRNPTGYVDNGYLSLEEVGVQYTIPQGWMERLGADRGSLSLSARNLGFLWRQQWRTDLGDEKVFDVRQSLGNEEFGGQQDSQTPPTSAVVLRARVSF